MIFPVAGGSARSSCVKSRDFSTFDLSFFAGVGDNEFDDEGFNGDARRDRSAGGGELFVSTLRIEFLGDWLTTGTADADASDVTDFALASPKEVTGADPDVFAFEEAFVRADTGAESSTGRFH